MKEIIEIKNLTKKFGDFFAVDNLNLKIYEGELFSLLGVNGAGKTTTIKLLCGLLSATSGTAIINGYSILTNLNRIKNFINISPQETAIAPNLTVKENIEFIARLYGLKNENLKNNVTEMINKFDLKQVENKKAKILSGGMQRRLSIAMALVTNPKILFLDEPTLGLDVIARRELWKIIKELQSSVTILLTTHYMEEAEKLSNRVGIMNHGKLIDCGTVDELLTKTNSKNLEDAFVTIVGENLWEF